MPADFALCSDDYCLCSSAWAFGCRSLGRSVDDLSSDVSVHYSTGHQGQRDLATERPDVRIIRSVLRTGKKQLVAF